MELNEFYSIAKINQETQNDYQLKNLGEQICIGVVGKSVRSGWGEKSYQTQEFYTSTTKDDYDRLFVSMICNFKPPYNVCNLINFHYNDYIKKNNDYSIFIKHIKYVILPLIKEQNKEIYIELVQEWLNSEISLKTNSIKTKGSENITLQDISNSNIIINNAKSE